MELVTAVGAWLLPAVMGACYLLETPPSAGRHWTFQISFLCLTEVANGQREEMGTFLWGVRNGVCEYVDLREGGLSTPKTEEDVRWVEVARKSSRQLWWPTFLKSYGLGIICFANTLDDVKVDCFFFLLPLSAYPSSYIWNEIWILIARR